MKKTGIKFLATMLICLTLLGGVAPKAHAQWMVDIVGNFGGAGFGWVLDYVDKIICALVKKEVIGEVISLVEDEIGGSDGAKFITDWRDALQTQPDEVTQVQMKNLFSTLGKGKDGGYEATGGGSGYASAMLEDVKKSVLDNSKPEVINLAEYGVNEASAIFTNQKNMRAFMTAYGSSGKIGNKIEATLYAESQKMIFDEMNKKLAEAQAISNGGFYSATSNGQVITPGATIRDMMASAQAMSFQQLANTDNIAEVVAGLLSRVISGAIDEGIGEAKKNSQNNSSSGQTSASENVKGSYGDLSQ